MTWPEILFNLFQRFFIRKFTSYLIYVLIQHLILATHDYTSVRQHASVRIAVIEPVIPVNQSDTEPIIYDKMEIICPDVVLPGTFFNCTADIPKGQGLSAVFTLTDDLTKENKTSDVKVPGESNVNDILLPCKILKFYNRDNLFSIS